MSNITVIILTHNEQKHIARCIKSVIDYVDDVVIVDSYSTDNTLSIAKELTARVYENAWINYSTQFNWALENTSISTDWVMRLDADEYVENPEELFDQLDSMPKSVTGINIIRKYYFLGKWMRRGGMYPLYHLRIWRLGSVKIENRWMDEHAVLLYGRAVDRATSIIDDNKNNIDWWIQKHNSYASREMIDILNLKYYFLSIDESNKEVMSSQAKIKRIVKEDIYTKLPIFIRSTLFFLYRYIIRLGFLDGKIGFAFHFFQTYWYRTLVDAKVLEAERWLSNESDPENIRKILAEKTGLEL